MMLGYKSNNNVVYSSKYHVIWCPKYRHKVLVGDIAKRLEEIMRKTALKSRAEISTLEIVPDQVHMPESACQVSGRIRTWSQPLAVHRSKSLSSTWRIKRMSDEYITPTPYVPSVTAAVARSHCSLIRRFESQARAAPHA